jgi:hypothetical protein
MCPLHSYILTILALFVSALQHMQAQVEVLYHFSFQYDLYGGGTNFMCNLDAVDTLAMAGILYIFASWSTMCLHVQYIWAPFLLDKTFTMKEEVKI